MTDGGRTTHDHNSALEPSAQVHSKLGRRRWGLASCQVSSKYIQQLRWRNRKMFQPIRGQGGHLGFPITTKKHKLGRGRWGLAFCQVSSKSIQRLRWRSWKIIQPNQHEIHKFERVCLGLVICQVSSKSIKQLWRSWLMFQLIRCQGGHLGFLTATKNTKLLEDVEVLLPLKFCQNPFSSCGEEVEKCFSQSGVRVSILDFGHRTDGQRMTDNQWSQFKTKLNKIWW